MDQDYTLIDLIVDIASPCSESGECGESKGAARQTDTLCVLFLLFKVFLAPCGSQKITPLQKGRDVWTCTWGCLRTGGSEEA